ncbi:RHS repeat-associated core domain-containing protein, partial [Burkholderia sp. SR8]|uniref:RHS repeat-associated core domain-containing protein n=1 Tax=Burkholderia sp. SR8 TaxID=3062277 RepID=UPI004062B900
ISPIAKERFAFDPASNIIDPVRTAETPASRPSPVRPESTLPVEVPKVLGNLLKAYAGMHFEYDARGNLVRKRTPAGEQEYEWDGFNRLLSARVVETSRQSHARYFYDAFGRRIAKEVNGERTVFGWDGDALAYESDGERGTHYLYEPGTFVPLAQYVAEPVEGIATPEWKSTDRYVPEADPLQKVPERRGEAAVFYYHCDQIGTPQLLTDGDGDVVWEASYKAWGEAREVIARASKAAGIVARNPLRFQGQQVDDETGLAYNRYRYYDPETGRFTSEDPIGLNGGANVYQYAPNPIEWIDPLGLARIPKSVKDKIAKENQEFFGKGTCECCGVEVVPGKKSQRGITPPTNERQFDHIEPDVLGGANDEDNTQVLCRKCNRRLWDKIKDNFKRLNRLGRTPCDS